MNKPKLNNLLNTLCVEYGFCLIPEAKDRLIGLSITDPKEFINTLIREEGLEPETIDLHLYRAMLDLVRQAMREP